MSDGLINLGTANSWEQKFSKSGVIYIKCTRCGFEVKNTYWSALREKHRAEICDKWIAAEIMES